MKYDMLSIKQIKISKKPLTFSVAMLLSVMLSFPVRSVHAAGGVDNGGTLQDTTPPVLTNLSFTPISVDVTTGAATVTVNIHATDDLAGIGYVYMNYNSPSNGQQGYVYLDLISGTNLDGDYQGTLTIPKLAEAGDWVISYVSLADKTSNHSSVGATQLTALGLPTQLHVISTVQDVTPPQLDSFNFTPASIDVSSGQKMLTFTIGLSDDQAGVDFCTRGGYCYSFVTLTSPSGKQSQRQYPFYRPFAQLSGAVNRGVWQTTLTLPQYAEAGIWSVSAFGVQDAVGNHQSYDKTVLQVKGFPTTFNVSATPSDTQAPELNSLTFSPNFVDTTAADQAIKVTLGATDNLSGIPTNYDYWSTPNSQPPIFHFKKPSSTYSTLGAYMQTRLSGTATNGTYTGTLSLPQYSEAGTWLLSQVDITDAVGNRVSYDNAQLTAKGIPTSVEVIKPSTTDDGIISDPATGGSVSDTTFGDRASISATGGVLNNPTGVSIDVLSTNLNLPMPGCFPTNATNYVSIKFNPPATQPLPAPGITLVLPLLNQMAAGTKLVLYRTDAVSGNLIANTGIGGKAVEGTVNADGMSATFTGVTSFTTVVGLIPCNTVLGDLDGDNQVNCADIAIVRAAFGKKLGEAGFDNRADVNHDKVVNIRDLMVVSRSLPATVTCRITNTGAVPAPANLKLN
ncbi:MAG: hypothetical protein HOP02_16835 [Methylococcaceae bacterium]|nr:hypothetical protein [Methylococcaceae bacterium]